MNLWVVGGIVVALVLLTRSSVGGGGASAGGAAGGEAGGGDHGGFSGPPPVRGSAPAPVRRERDIDALPGAHVVSNPPGVTKVSR